jgi:hypothetical protein
MLNIVISLVFVYLLYSLFATIVMEIISSLFALRANNLKRALKTMLTNGDQNFFDEFMEHDSLFKQLSGKMSGKRTPPSYINPKNFSLMMMNVLEKSSNGLSLVEDQIETLPNGEMKDVIKMYFNEAESNIDQFKRNLEGWFNDIMDRASGWFKRRIKVILIIVGFFIAMAFNVDTLVIFSQLKNAEVASQVAENAALFIENMDSDQVANIEGGQLNNEISKLNQISLGLGWDGYFDEEGSLAAKLFFSILGWLITALAISLGAPFWFDLLAKLVNIRGAGQMKEIVIHNKIQGADYSGSSEKKSISIEG